MQVQNSELFLYLHLHRDFLEHVFKQQLGFDRKVFGQIDKF